MYYKYDEPDLFLNAMPTFSGTVREDEEDNCLKTSPFEANLEVDFTEVLE